jgi:hypothetical protein
MRNPQDARNCDECNGWYNSESELRDHMKTAHRRFVPEQSTFQHGRTLPNGFEKQLGTSKEEWTKLSIQLRNRVHVLFNSKELEAVDRFILLVSQGPIFDDVRRQAQLAKLC